MIKIDSKVRLKYGFIPGKVVSITGDKAKVLFATKWTYDIPIKFLIELK